MKDTYILGIESSCDETSVTIVKNGIEEIATSTSTQIDIHKDFGGVVPETAKTLAFVHNKPLIPVHHIAGHIYANSLVKELSFPLLALVVSGGHTEIIEMKEHYKFNKLGGTLDDAIGECYDKVARVIGLEYPGGPKIDKLAKLGKPTYKLPVPLKDDSYNFSFSGLKSAVINLAHNEEQRGNKLNEEDLATSFQTVAIESISIKIRKAIIEKGIKTVIVAGGVAANQGLREEMQKISKELNVDLSIPPMKYCTDNATMIAAAGYYAYLDGRRADLSLNSKSQDKLV